MTSLHYLAACEGLSAVAGTAFHTAIDGVRTPALIGPAKAFADGIDRIAGLLWLPPFITIISSDWSKSVEQTLHELPEITGRTSGINESEIIDNVADRTFQLMSERQAIHQKIDPEWRTRLLFGALNCGRFIESEIPGIASSTETMLRASIILLWSFFEAWAGDMWEAAVNAHPDDLAELRGSPKRIEKAAREENRRTKSAALSSGPATGDEKVKSVSLATIHRLTRGTYDLSERMGSLLRENYSFDRIDGIRHAYSAAFHEHAERIDAALKDRSIDALSAVRNVIVHRAGIADADYVRRSEYLQTILHVGVNESIKIDGELVSKLSLPVVQCSADLLRAVDAWLLSHRRHA